MRSSSYRQIYWFCITFLALWLLAPYAQAKLEIEILEGVSGAIPIAIVPLKWEATTPPPLTLPNTVVADDLYRSGLFSPMPAEDIIAVPATGEEIRFAAWQALKNDYIVVGRITGDVVDGYEVSFELFDIHTQQRLLAQVMPIKPGDLRYAAHRIADAVYERIIGKPGAFATRIAYITATGTGDNIEFQLMVADADGFSPQAIATSPEPLLSPAWSPDGNRIAYVSFEKGNSAIYIQNILTGSRQLISSFKGINGAPSFSPDGSRLAMSLSKSGNSEIYLHKLGTRDFSRLTNHWGIDTEPVWGPNGRYIYFTSDRAGRPQIYRILVAGGSPERISWEGEYNARASVSIDSKQIAMVQGNKNRYRIAIQDLESNRLIVVSNGILDESPSFAPNGSMILYASKEDGKGVLSAVSVDGRVKQRLVLSEGDVREPAWSPVIQ
ncbi:MAG: Tol-Pal system beta propeller repeat protein TolB [Proteobacteria bacterium]|nr:Tol-Pal system beta propeller repeat protein TolB [Pseudomonadota bacterium]